MSSQSYKRSLLPFLDPEASRILMQLPLCTEETDSPEGLCPPLLVLDDSDPVCRILAARIVTDAGSSVQDVFLLAQKDVYAESSDSLRPVTNRIIDQHWQSIYSLCSTERDVDTDRPILMASQLDGSGRLAPWDPIFLCRASGKYFHPVCPVCHSHLELCRDDELISQSGLAPYSTSLRRYLFCPSCFASKQSEIFYSFHTEPHERGKVKDWRGLIAGYRPPPGSGATGPPGLDCARCERQGRCYTDLQTSLLPIAPVFFYPFYMLAFKSADFKARDFLFLLSGASCEELIAQLQAEGEPGRIQAVAASSDLLTNRSRLFFDDEDSRFLEILYLKLAFLAELADRIRSWGSSFAPSNPGRILSRCWVSVPRQAARLPALWSFSLVALPPGSILPGDPPLFAGSAGQRLGEVGLVWLYVLLVNKGRTIMDLYQVLERCGLPDGAGAKDEVRSRFIEAFPPECLFWDARGGPVRQEWTGFWHKALSIGCSLALGLQGEGVPQSIDDFLADTRVLMSTIRTSLFAARPDFGERKLTRADDQVILPQDGGKKTEKIDVKAIRSILESVLQEWRLSQDRLESAATSEPAQTAAAGEAQPENAVDSWVETVRLDSCDTGEDLAIPETIIIPRGPAAAAPSAAPTDSPRAESAADGKVSGRQDEASAKEQPDQEEEIPETVIFRPLKDKRGPGKGKP